MSIQTCRRPYSTDRFLDKLRNDMLLYISTIFGYINNIPRQYVAAKNLLYFSLRYKMRPARPSLPLGGTAIKTLTPRQYVAAGSVYKVIIQF